MKRMVTFKVLLVVLSLLYCFSASAQIKAVDAESGLPVSYASVFDDATGKVLGITSSDGLLPSAAGSCAKVSVQHLSYKPATVDVSDIADHAIKLTPREAYPVNEVTVNKAKSDYMRLKFYVRQYTMINGVMSAVGEGLYYGYYDNVSKKRKKTLLLSQKQLRNESIFKGQKWQVEQVAKYTSSLPNVDIASAIGRYSQYNDGQRHRIYNGKNKVRTFFYRHDDKAQRLELVSDSGYVDKPFNLWLFGVSVSDVYGVMSFSSAYGKPSLSTLQSITFSGRITHNKTKAAVDRYTEVYVLGVDYDTKSGFKALEKQLAARRKSGTEEPFVRPEGFPAFNRYVAEAMTHMTEVTE